jgi:hypothetical protein
MGLVEIKTFADLLAFLPLLVKLHDQLDGYWQSDTSVTDFVALLTNNFGKAGSKYYGIKNGDKLSYFIAVLDDGKPKATFWLFYVNKEHYKNTKNLVKTLFSDLKSLGYSELSFTTTRMTRSYDRWVSGFGARKHSLNYKLSL